jgi:5S rRNA maturation endonuclease (ribonuclease M5)
VAAQEIKELKGQKSTVLIIYDSDYNSNFLFGAIHKDTKTYINQTINVRAGKTKKKF